MYFTRLSPNLFGTPFQSYFFTPKEECSEPKTGAASSSFCGIYLKVLKTMIQAGAELGQAQLKLGLDFD